jgi:hypothetical protein
MSRVDEVRELFKRADEYHKRADAIESLLREMRLGAKVEASPRGFRFFGCLSISGPREKKWDLDQLQRSALTKFLRKHKADMTVAAKALEAEATEVHNA